MSSVLRIVVAGEMWSVGPILKAGYTDGMIGITLMGNADAFPSVAFGWLCPRPISLIA